MMAFCANTSSYTGKERDTESGLDYFGARYYSSSMGRFSSPDPSGLMYADLTDPQSLNLYSYVRNNPLSNTDPTGMECMWDDGSYDSADDPDSGGLGKCSNLGGTWIDPGRFENAVLTNGQTANIQRGDWSSQASSTMQQSWLVPSAMVTGSATGIPMTGNNFSFSDMTQAQAISMFQQAGFVYSPADTLLSRITNSHPGVNMRGNNSICSVHLNILPGSGQNGTPVTGNFHYDYMNPLVPFSDSLSPEGTAAHAVVDVIPDLLGDKASFPKTWTGNYFCK